MATFITDGAVTLYHNNAAKFATTATGVSVTGATYDTSIADGVISLGSIGNISGANSSILSINSLGSVDVNLDTNNNDTGSVFRVREDSDVWFTVENSGNVTVAGAISATSKSFVIPHPTKENKTLRHGSLEGPEHGVYVRGTLQDSGVIELPDYWLGLVDEDTITVQLTGKGRFQRLYVDKIEDNKIYVENEKMHSINCYYFVQAERKDIDKMVVEY